MNLFKVITYQHIIFNKFVVIIPFNYYIYYILFTLFFRYQLKTVEMYDIESQIQRISGQQNYMESLQKVTGDPMHIDMEFYHDKHSKLCHCDNNIKVLLKKLTDMDSACLTVKNNYFRLSEEINIKDNTFQIYQKKASKKTTKPKRPREIIAQGYHPPELIKTDWFKLVKQMEKDINKYLHNVFPDAAKGNKSIEAYTYGELQTELNKNPELVDMYLVFDCRIINEQQFTAIGLMKKSCRVIINTLLTPMYDVKRTIESHWSDINRIFNSKAFQQLQNNAPDGNVPATPADIVNILAQFVVAKYRCTITGNNKHYVKLFVNVLGDESVSNLDGARFMEIMDSLNLEQFDKQDTVYQFATGAKQIMKHIANADNVTPELLQEIDGIFNPTGGQTPPNPEVTTPADNTEGQTEGNNETVEQKEEHDIL